MTLSPHLGHVEVSHQDDGGEEEGCGDDQQKDIAEVEKLLVLGGSPGPGPQGHHTRTSHHRHDGWLSLLFVKIQTLKGKSLNILHNMAAGRSWSWLGPTQTLPVETGRGNRVQVAR